MTSSRRAGRRVLARFGQELSERERAVLAMLDQHRYLTTRHLQAFCFTTHATPISAARTTSRVLSRLHELRLITRLQRRIGGVRAGSASYVWTLAPAGHRLLHPAATRRRPFEPTLTFLAHDLAVADAHLALRDVAPTTDRELLRVESEPHCWRDYTGPGGGRETLKPDLYAVLADADYEDHYFLEIDRGTEGLPRLLAKCRQYATYRRHHLGDAGFPLVVWLLNDAARAERFGAEIARQAGLDPRMFRVGTMTELPRLVAPEPMGAGGQP